MALVLTDMQKVTLMARPVTAAGNPATIDGSLGWTSSDETIISLAVAADAMSAVATAVGPLGSAQVTVLANIDGKEITGVIDIDVIASEAVSISIEAGAPEPK